MREAADLPAMRLLALPAAGGVGDLLEESSLSYFGRETSEVPEV